MKMIRTEEAVGHVLCHDVTQIIPGEFKGARFRKGHVVRPEDIPVLLSLGKEQLYIWEIEEGFLHENDAAERMCRLCISDGMEAAPVKEGKIEIRAARPGLFCVDRRRLNEVNAIEELMIATRMGNTPVKEGDILCGTRVIPLVIDEKKLLEAEKIVNGTPILSLHPYRLKKAAVIVTGNEVLQGRIEDRFTPVLVEKLRVYGIEVTEKAVVGDGLENIIGAVDAVRKTDAEVILCTGGMSVDPDDNTPGAIKRSGAHIVTYGTPVLPGAMFLLGYFDDGKAVMGLPSSVMHAKKTVFDRVMPRIAAGITMSRQDFVEMGEGGLILES